MAHTITLYPYSDVNLRHDPSRGSTGYNLINEASTDTGTTYIYQTLSGSNASLTSQFNCSESSSDSSVPTGKIKIRSVTVEVVWTTVGENINSITGSLTPGVAFGSGSYTTGTQSTKTNTSENYTTTTTTISNLPEEGNVYDNISYLNTKLQLVTTGRYTT